MKSKMKEETSKRNILCKYKMTLGRKKRKRDWRRKKRLEKKERS